MILRRYEPAVILAQKALSSFFWLSGLTTVSEILYDKSSAIRIVSYHRTDPLYVNNLETHFRFFAEHYIPATWNDLIGHISGVSPWPYKKTGIIIAFDDGGLSNFTVARPLLRCYGFTGLFLIPAAWIDIPREKQQAYAAAHRIEVSNHGRDAGLAMSWSQIRQLVEEGDKIVSHTYSHHRFSPSDTPEILFQEILKSKEILEDRLTIPIDTFGWVGGETDVYRPAVFQMIRDAGYSYILSTILGLNKLNTNPLLIRRTALSDNWSLAQVRFWLLPISDRRYRHKEKLVCDRLGMSPIVEK